MTNGRLVNKLFKNFTKGPLCIWSKQIMTDESERLQQYFVYGESIELFRNSFVACLSNETDKRKNVYFVKSFRFEQYKKSWWFKKPKNFNEGGENRGKK